MSRLTSSSVVITGDGVICALGVNVDQSLRRLYAGSVPEPRPSLPSSLSPAPPVFSIPEFEHADGSEGLYRTSALAVHAAEEAVQGAFGGAPDHDPARIGVAVGTTTGCTLHVERFYPAYRNGEGPDPRPLNEFIENDLAGILAHRIGARGPRATIVNACASGTDAIALASFWIRSGACDIALAGGADALERFTYLGFFTLKNTSLEPCRPFDRRRTGLNLGEGAGFVILERGSLARARSARVLGHVLGYGNAGDAHHPTAPHPEGRGLRRAIGIALDDSGLTSQEIGFVNAHGTGTPDNDRVEGRALADLFSPAVTMLSTKGYTGHTLGAAGAVEAVLTARNLLDGRVPGSAGFREYDEECVVRPTTEGRTFDAASALSTSLAFGGVNSALVLGRGDR